MYLSIAKQNRKENKLIEKKKISFKFVPLFTFVPIQSITSIYFSTSVQFKNYLEHVIIIWETTCVL